MGFLKSFGESMLKQAQKDADRIHQQIESKKNEYNEKLASASTSKLKAMHTQAGGLAREEIERELSRRGQRP